MVNVVAMEVVFQKKSPAMDVRVVHHLAKWEDSQSLMMLMIGPLYVVRTFL